MNADPINPFALIAAYARATLRPKPRRSGRRRDPDGRRRRRGQAAAPVIRPDTREEN